MANGVVILDSVAASNIDARVFNFVSSTVDYDNGNVFTQDVLSTDADKGEVFEAIPVDLTMNKTMMAYNAGDAIVTDTMGEKYKIGLLDPRKYTNAKGLVFSGYAPMIGDKITLSVDGIDGAKGANTYIVAVTGSKKLTWASAPVAGLSYRLLKQKNISISDGQLNSNGNLEAYQFICEAV